MPLVKRQQKTLFLSDAESFIFHPQPVVSELRAQVVAEVLPLAQSLMEMPGATVHHVPITARVSLTLVML